MTERASLLSGLGVPDTIDETFLDRAFTHASYAKRHNTEDYEYLEFVGDPVVNLHVAAYFAKRFPHASPGDLTEWRQTIVPTTQLGERGMELGFLPFIRMFGVDDRAHVNICGDVVEALFGAVFLSLGYPATHPLATRFLRPLVEAFNPEVSHKPATNALQEYVRAHKLGTLRYEDSATGPANALHWHSQVFVGEQCLGSGSDRTRKAAHAQAAKQALATLTEGG